MFRSVRFWVKSCNRKVEGFEFQQEAALIARRGVP